MMRQSMDKELSRETVFRHKRGFQALINTAKNLYDIESLDTPKDIEDYLNTIPSDLKPMMTNLVKKVRDSLNEI